MSISYKNKLLEWYQKNKEEMPKFETIRLSGDDHSPIFESKIMINNTVYSTTGPRKKDAELKLSELVYKTIEKFHENLYPTRSKCDIKDLPFDRYETVYIIDAENIDLPKNKINKTELYLLFAAKNHTKNWIYEYQSVYDNCFVIISESIGADSADCFICFTLGRLSVLYKNKNWVVASRDHFIQHLSSFMDCKVICSFE